MIDLSLVPMDDILVELDKRFDTVVLLTNKIMSPSVDDLHYHFKDKIGCLGLLRIADARIKSTYIDEQTSGFTDED